MSVLTLLDSVDGGPVDGPKLGPGMGVSGTWLFTVKAIDFGGGKVQLQLSDDDGATWIPPTINSSPNSFSENSVVRVKNINNEMAVRAVLLDAVNAQNVTATLTQTT